MGNQLEIHPASESEKIEAYRNVHEVWGGGLSLEAHVERRLASTQHNRARWFVGCWDDRVVTSLGCFPVQFRLNGQIEPGIAIGSVHTVPQHRGQGFAPQLIRWVEEHERARGAALSLLYSDIDPGYYAKLGYERCAAWERWTAVPPAGEEGTTLTRIDPQQNRSKIAELYDQFHSRLPLSIARDGEYWDDLFAKGAGDQFYLLENRDGDSIGYAWLRREPDRLTIRDWAVAPDADAASDTDAHTRTLFQAILCTASECRAKTAGGWLPDCAATRAAFGQPALRQREITMLKPIRPGLRIRQACLAAAQHFREIDHV